MKVKYNDIIYDDDWMVYLDKKTIVKTKARPIEIIKHYKDPQGTPLVGYKGKAFFGYGGKYGIR